MNCKDCGCPLLGNGKYQLCAPCGVNRLAKAVMEEPKRKPFSKKKAKKK